MIQNHGQARSAFERALALAPVEADAADFDALFNLATELVNAGRMDEARPYLQRFIDEAPRERYAADIDKPKSVYRPD